MFFKKTNERLQAIAEKLDTLFSQTGDTRQAVELMAERAERLSPEIADMSVSVRQMTNAFREQSMALEDLLDAFEEKSRAEADAKERYNTYTRNEEQMLTLIHAYESALEQLDRMLTHDAGSAGGYSVLSGSVSAEDDGSERKPDATGTGETDSFGTGEPDASGTGYPHTAASGGSAEEDTGNIWRSQLGVLRTFLQKKSAYAGVIFTGETGERVDYEIHDVIEARETPVPEADKTVAEVFETGMIYQGRVCHKAKVAAFRYQGGG